MKDRFPKWWVLYSVAKSLFLKFGIISFLLIFFLCSISIIMDEYVRPEAYLYAITSCLLLFGPFAINYVIAKKRKKKILAVVEKIKETGHFNPESGSEGWLFWKKYLPGFRLSARNLFVRPNLPGQCHGCHWLRCLQPDTYRG